MRDDLAWDPDEPGVVVDDRADRSERCPCRRSHELDADLLEEIEGSLVHRIELILVEKLHVAERVPGRRPGKERWRRTGRPAIRPLAARPPTSCRIVATRICNHKLHYKRGGRVRPTVAARNSSNTSSPSVAYLRTIAASK